MVSRWILSGVGSELTADIEDLISSFLQTKWAETNPVKTDIKFGDDWWDDNGDFQIHCNETITKPTRIANGGQFALYETLVDIHIFCRRLGEMQTDPQLGNMQREIMRIMHLFPTQVAAGMLSVTIKEIRDIPEPTNIRTVWHSLITVSVIYSMARIES